MLNDLRFAFNRLQKSPGFTAIAVLTLAVGLGANTAMFSLIDSVLLQPLPFREPGRLVTVRCVQPNLAWPVVCDYAEYLDWKAQTDVFAELALYKYQNYVLAETGATPRSLVGQEATDNYLRTLGLQPALGRDFVLADCVPNAAPVALISHGLWQTQFGGDPGIVGRNVKFSGVPTTIIGVLPRGFRGVLPYERPLEVLKPFRETLETSNRGWHYLNTFGRLRDGVTLPQARQRMNEVGARLQKENNITHAIATLSLQEWATTTSRGRLTALMAAVGLVLLVACVNLANLQLVRVTGRTAEISIKMALGAGRGRIARDILLEGLLVGAAGGLLGLGFAAAALRLAGEFIQSQFATFAPIALNGPSVAFAFGLTLLAVVLSALVPAWRAAVSWDRFMRAIGRSMTATPEQRRMNNAFIVAQVAVTLLLLVGAGLLLRSMQRILTQDNGFQPGNVLVFSLNLPDRRYPDRPSRRVFFEQLLTGIRALPGVELAATADSIPMSANSNGNFSVKGLEWPHGQEPIATKASVGPDYFRTLGVRVVRGREFSAADGGNAAPAVIVNEAFAEKYFPGRDPVGQEITFDGDSDWCRIIGVVRNVRLIELDREVEPAIFSCYLQSWTPGMFVIVRTALDPSVMINTLRGQVGALDKELPFNRLNTLQYYVDFNLLPRRLITWTIGVAAGAALALAMLGLYSVISYTVVQQTREIGVRMAIGAEPGMIGAWVLRRGFGLVLLGVAVGLGGSVIVARLLGSLVYGVRAWDPTTYAGVIGLLGAISLLACWLPARRAARVDPLVALRSE